MRHYLRKYPFLILFTSLLILGTSIYVSMRFPLATSEMFEEDAFAKPQEPVAFNEQIPQENAGDMPWERHPVHSVPVESKHTVQQMYNYELNKDDFTQLFRQTFVRSCSPKLVREDWVEVSMDSHLEPNYRDFLKWFQLRVRSMNTGYQVVHDRLRTAMKHIAHTGHILYYVEAIIYRVGAYHGKHIEMWVQYTPEKTYEILTFQVIGEVKEEAIYFHPIQSHDPVDTAFPFAENEDGVSGNPFLKTLTDTEIEGVVARQQAKLNGMPI